jgi:hypothetical protein
MTVLSMRSKLDFSSGKALLSRVALQAGALVLLLAAFAIAQRAHATTDLCAGGVNCERQMLAATDKQIYRYENALQRTAGSDAAVRRAELSDQDYTQFSGVGVIACSIDGTTRTATAFLVGAFDIAVTVAHEFEKDSAGAEPADCMYNSMDSLGQVRERIPVLYVKSQWQSDSGASGQPAKDLAVVRLSQPSRYAQRTMPLGRFSGSDGPVVMIGYPSGSGADTIKRKARGTVYDRSGDGVAAANVTGFTHDMDARGMTAGAPVIDENTGVIIGVHTRLKTSRNAMITMNDWLEATLRTEMQSHAAARAETDADAETRSN